VIYRSMVYASSVPEKGSDAVRYCVIILDGAAGWPLHEYGGRTTLQAASTPNLDRLVREGAYRSRTDRSRGHRALLICGMYLDPRV
jgi:hypothetical protein